MSAKIIQFKESEVSRLLEEAVENNFEAVVVFGFKDGDFITMASPLSITTTVGALEIMKHYLLAD